MCSNSYKHGHESRSCTKYIGCDPIHRIGFHIHHRYTRVVLTRMSMSHEFGYIRDMEDMNAVCEVEKAGRKKLSPA
jgi:hypothetical protein